MNEARMLGVLGGMGPLAGATFMQRLTLLTPATRLAFTSAMARVTRASISAGSGTRHA
jgi:aspartate/glutamate racemase